MLSELQQQLAATYRTAAPDVNDFLITDPRLADVIGGGAMLAGSSETLFVAEDDDGVAMSLFLDADLLARLESADPLSALHAGLLSDFWQVVEGVSHFLCVAFKANHDRTVSLFELELQAEIDKFVSAAQLAVAQNDNSLLAGLHSSLFDDVRFHDELAPECLDRYKAANDYAARFCYGLEPAFLGRGAEAYQTLREFYRLPSSEKVSLIHTGSYHC